MVETFREPRTGSTAGTCLMCGAATENDPGLCSTHCRAEADMELRRNRARMQQLRRPGGPTGHHGRELRGLLDRNATLDLAIINSAPLLDGSRPAR